MKIKLERADIVIVADAHNPSIASPQWLKEKGLIVEEPKQFIHTPDFSFFDSETFSLMVDRQRLQIMAKKQDIDTLEKLSNVGKRYVELLPHIPYRALGLNFVWLSDIDEEKYFPKINVIINSINDLSYILPGHEIDCGCIIYASKKPYLLKLTINPQGNHALVFNFNYHHEVRGLEINIITDYINNLLSLYRNSREIVEKICFRRKESD